MQQKSNEEDKPSGKLGSKLSGGDVGTEVDGWTMEVKCGW